MTSHQLKDLGYGIALTTLISKVLADLKRTDQPITVFLIYDTILDERPQLKDILAPNRDEKEKFYERIRNCLRALCDKGLLVRENNLTKTKTIYHTYIVKF